MYKMLVWPLVDLGDTCGEFVNDPSVGKINAS